MRPLRIKAFVPLLVLLAGLLFVLISYHVARSAHAQRKTRLSAPMLSDLNKAQRHLFFDEEIEPLLELADARNRAAVDRAVARLEQRFRNYHMGIDEFAEDITGWGARFGIVGKTAQDLWTRWWDKKENADEVRRYVTGKYERHIVSGDQLEKDIRDVIHAYREDLVASRNRLYADIQLAIRLSHHEVVIPEADFEDMKMSINDRIREMAADASGDSVVVGVAAIVGGMMVEEGVRVGVTALLSQLVSSTAVTTASSGGGLTTGTAAGGSVGSSAGPAGTIIGLGVGMVVGAIVDWWMTDKFKEHVAADCTEFLKAIEQQLLYGDETQGGLKSAFDEAADLADRSQREFIHEFVIGGSR